MSTHTHTQKEHAQTWGGIAVGFDDEAHKSKTVARGDVDELKLSQQHVISLSYKEKSTEKIKKIPLSRHRGRRSVAKTPNPKLNPKP
jgi:hypothetical protein